MTLQEKIINCRKKHGLTQTELAKVLDVRVATVSDWERGNTRPYKRNMDRMAEIFGVPFEDEEAVETGKLITVPAERWKRLLQLEELVLKYGSGFSPAKLLLHAI